MAGGMGRERGLTADKSRVAKDQQRSLGSYIPYKGQFKAQLVSVCIFQRREAACQFSGLEFREA